MDSIFERAHAAWELARDLDDLPTLEPLATHGEHTLKCLYRRYHEVILRDSEKMRETAVADEGVRPGAPTSSRMARQIEYLARHVRATETKKRERPADAVESQPRAKRTKGLEVFVSSTLVEDEEGGAKVGYGVTFSQGKVRAISGCPSGKQTSQRGMLKAMFVALTQTKEYKDVVILSRCAKSIKKVTTCLGPWKANHWRKKNGARVEDWDLLHCIDYAMLRHQGNVSFKYCGFSGSMSVSDACARAAVEKELS